MMTAAESGYRPVRPAALQGGTEQAAAIKAFELTPAHLLEQLEPSSRWAQEHFHP
jgi:hypothetical protein